MEKIKNFIPKEAESKVLEFWEKEKIFEKTLKKTLRPVQGKKSKDYVFYDGPPFATGLPHYGHILAGIIKDVFPRYQTMKGKYVERKWGWDCHGLPIENIVEQELGLKTKKDIEKIGVLKFNEAARNRVMSYSDDWKKIIPKIGRWVDMENDYKTMDKDYMESVLWVFKTLYDKGLIYEGYKSMHICPRCETTLSNFEVTQGYKDITDLSATVKFELKQPTPLPSEQATNPASFGAGNQPRFLRSRQPTTYLLAWTTTPWTLPGNVALAIGADIKYQILSIKGENGRFIIAKNRVSDVLKDKEYKLIKEIKGSELVGKKYKPAFDYYQKKDLENREKGWKIYGAKFVTAKEGTGIVHIAPAFGEDDLNLARKEKLPFIQHVSISGEFKPEVKDFAGMKVKPKAETRNEFGSAMEQNSQTADIEIIKWLARDNKLFSKQKITHPYPHCWRCDTPLLNYATSSWFVKVTSIKKKILENNIKTNWIPPYLREGRFGNWIKDAPDWAVSRSRYWGAPLPVWKCDKCKKIKTVGSVAEIKKLIPKSGNKYFAMRHGQSENNVQNIINSKIEANRYRLTEKGKKQAIDAAEKLKKQKIDLIFSSDFLRTKETAELVAKTIELETSKIIFDRRLREINTGVFDGKTGDDYHKYFASFKEKFLKAPPEGENLNDLKKRITEFLYDADKKYSNKNILIVSHEYPIWNLFAGSQGLNTDETIKLRGKANDFVKFAEIKKLDFTPISHNKNYELDLHRPYIDDVRFVCDKCKGEMKRIPDVFDCWFESGAMPYSQSHYPFDPSSISSRRSDNYGTRNKKNKLSSLKRFPAEFIAEGIDQTRGWFYTLMVLSTGLFNKPAFKNVVVNGIILAENGQKMSKKLKNYPDPMEIIEKYGADALRLYLLSSPAVRAESLNFSEKGVDEIYKKVILRLWNTYSFYEIYTGEPTTNPAFFGTGNQSRFLRDR
ncbi:MAG: class I tRNA ligase family protein, partial [Patescibacteria group bacterium]|nr:class I tRNA ligase family protein [Patescibacteria group bacterium]